MTGSLFPSVRPAVQQAQANASLAMRITRRPELAVMDELVEHVLPHFA